MKSTWYSQRDFLKKYVGYENHFMGLSSVAECGICIQTTS